MKTSFVVSRLLHGFVLGSLLLLGVGGCQDTGPLTARNTGASAPSPKIPGPHNNLIIVNTYSPGSQEAKDWYGLSPTLIIDLPTTENAYPTNSSGSYTALTYNVPDETGSVVDIPGPHNIVLVRLSPATIKNGATRLSCPPQVHVHLMSNPSDPAPDYHARATPFVVINLPERYHQGTAAQPAEYLVPPHQ